MPNPRLLLSLTTVTEATALVDTVDTAAMDTEASTEDTTASVRLRLSPRLLLSPTLAMVDMADAVDMVDTVLATAVVSMASVRPRLSPTSDMVDTVLVDTAATAMEDSTGDTMASVRLRPDPRLLPSPIWDMEDIVDTVLVDTAATAMEVS